MADLLKKYWKIILVGLFALAVLFGLSQRKQDPYVYFSHRPATQQNDNLQSYYQKAQSLTQKEQTQTTATFLAVGDIMLSRNVAAAIKKAGDPSLPFSRFADNFNSVDFTFGNLESPIASGSGIIGGHSMIFSSPKDYAQGLAKNKFKILNLANNHAMDQGLKGLGYTLKYLDSLGIRHVGTGNSLDEAWQPAAVETNGIKICFVGASYASVNDNGKTTNDYVARTEDTEKLKTQISNAKKSCDFIVATMHAGTEYTRKPNADQIAFAHEAVDDGADLVIGGHPHWIQTTEKYQGKFIFYSLGNFIFDQDWSQDTMEGLTLKIQISKSLPAGEAGKIQNPRTSGAAAADDLQGTRIPAKLNKIELIPVIIENQSTPRPATPEEAKKILDKIGIADSTLK